MALQANFKSPSRLGSLGEGASGSPAGSVPGAAGKGPGVDLERRNFLGMVVGGVGAAVAVSTLFPIVKYIIPPSNAVKDVSEKVVGKASDVPPKGFKIFQFNKDKVLVINDNGQLTACSAVCTHLGCLVHWESAAGQVACPCHGAKYKQTGEIISGPQPLPLKAYKVKVDGENLVVSKA
ncbi:MAG: Rieske 2Fe-2S domain-containing protein [Chlorobiaceae bacterium]|nr:Rieske 2Fe-2S domain-containing protein [Chlorobiaceae bacterium]